MHASYILYVLPRGAQKYLKLKIQLANTFFPLCVLAVGTMQNLKFKYHHLWVALAPHVFTI